MRAARTPTSRVNDPNRRASLIVAQALCSRSSGVRRNTHSGRETVPGGAAARPAAAAISATPRRGPPALAYSLKPVTTRMRPWTLRPYEAARVTSLARLVAFHPPQPTRTARTWRSKSVSVATNRGAEAGRADARSVAARLRIDPSSSSAASRRRLRTCSASPLRPSGC